MGEPLYQSTVLWKSRQPTRLLACFFVSNFETILDRSLVLRGFELRLRKDLDDDYDDEDDDWDPTHHQTNNGVER